MTDFFKKYKVNTVDFDPTNDAYLKHLGLKANINGGYKNATINQALDLINLFESTYPGIMIDSPLLREKSSKSMFFKIKNLEIERLSKLATIENDIPEKLHAYEFKKYGKIIPVNYKQLYKLFAERVDESIPVEKRDSTKQLIKNLLFKRADKLDIVAIENELIKNKKLSRSTKIAIVRILYSKIHASNIPSKADILNDIDANFGEKAAELSGVPEDDILCYQSIKSIEQSKYDLTNKAFDNRYSSKLDRLLDEQEFLRCKDLMGMQIIISQIPRNFKTNNYAIQQLIDKRDSISDKKSDEYIRLDQACMNAISKDFMYRLEHSSFDWLDKTNSKIIRDSIKHKNKSNGYIAEHIKFELERNPNYSLELQVKSRYVDEISHSKGSASHSARSGKQRILPSLIQEDTYDIMHTTPERLQLFKKNLDYLLPKFTIFSKEHGKYEHYDFSRKENSFKFFDELIEDDHDSGLKLAYLIDKLETSEKESAKEMEI